MSATATADAAPVDVSQLPPLARLDRAAIESIVASGRRLLVQGGMGIHASDGLAGKVAAHRGARLVGVGTVSAVVKTPDHLRREIRRARAEAPGGFVGLNLMAAINKAEFELSTRIAIEEGVSFIVQGAGISREIIKWCRAGNVPFAGIVSSGRLAAMYEKWGADFVVAEGAEAGGHIGDIGHPLPGLVDEVVAATSLPVVAAGGVDASDVARYLAAGAAGVQMASRFLACSDGDVHPNFKQMHLGKTDAEITLITSCVKGMKARAVRKPLHRGPGPRRELPAAQQGLVLRARGLPRPQEGLRRVPGRGSLPLPRLPVPRELLHHRRPAGRGHQGRHGEGALLHRLLDHPHPRADHGGAPHRQGPARGPGGAAGGGRAGPAGRDRVGDPALPRHHRGGRNPAVFPRASPHAARYDAPLAAPLPEPAGGATAQATETS